MIISNQVRELERHLNKQTPDKREQICIISKAQGLQVALLGNTLIAERNIAILGIAKRRIIRELQNAKQ